MSTSTSLPADPDFAALRDALAARHAPADTVERHWVEELAFAAWRQRRLRTLDAAALAAPSDTDEPDDDSPELPSLAVLARYRGRIERDHRLALAELERAQALRPDRQQGAPAGLAPAQLRWLADHIEGQAAQAPAGDTNEPETRTSEPEHRRPVIADARTAVAPQQPTPVAVTNEPDRAVAALNRQQRRRLAALDRQPFRRAA